METYKLVGLISGLIGIFFFLYFIYKMRFPSKIISWKTTEKAAEAITSKLISDDFIPTMIFGIGRGGAIFGAMISGCLGHCPLILIDRQHSWSQAGRIDDLIFPINIPPTYLVKVLLVAGPVYTGGTMKAFYDYLKAIGAKEVRRAVLLFQEGSPAVVEYFGVKSTNTQLLLPWMFTKQYIREDKTPSLAAKTGNQLTLYLVRHAETEAGNDIFLGVHDSDLSVKGIQQAINVGKFFVGKRIDKIYSSPLDRAVKTALILQSFVLKAEVAINPNLREMNYGLWDGVSRRKISSESPEDYAKWIDDPLANIPEGSESPELVLKRMQAFLDELEGQYSPLNNVEVVAVLHKTAIRVLLSHIEGVNLKYYRKFKVENCEIFQLYFDGNKWSSSSLEQSKQTKPTL